MIESNRGYDVMKDKNIFQQLLTQWNISLQQEQIDQFIKYYEMLVEWNQVMNLTAITEYEEVLKKHFIDSLSLIKVAELESEYKILDLGTGAGFPGIPLKIAFPSLKIVLLDSLNKRVKFLNAVIEELNLKNIEAIHGRAEDFGKKEEYREQFDYCVSRAVANLAVLSEYCMPYVKVGGNFVPYKSGAIEEELNSSKKAIQILGGKIKKVETFLLPDSDIERSLICIEKIKSTPKKYPRSAGKPSKEPLL